MGQIGFSCERGLVKHSECRKCMLQPTHPCAFTPDMLESMREENDFEPGREIYSPSRLMGCLRQSVLSTGKDYYTDIYNAYAMLRGHMSHRVFEDLPEQPGVVRTIREIHPRLTTTISTRYGDKTFSGKPDAIILHSRVDGTDTRYVAEIVDYKSTNEIGHDLTEARAEHVWQINMYRLLVARSLVVDGVRVDPQYLTIQYLDMRKPRRFTSEGSLQAKGKLIRLEKRNETLTLEPIPMYDYDVVEDEIARLIEAKIEAETTLPPPLIDEDKTWMCIKCPMKTICYEIADSMGEPHSW
jgi:hypothetical protein